MDPSLTQPEWRNWLPLIVVIAGGIITYFVTTIIEERKRHFELKRQVYFELIDQIVRAESLIKEYQRIEKETGKRTSPKFIQNILDDVMPQPMPMNTNQQLHAQYNLIQDMIPKFESAKLKVKVCGSEKIKNLMDDWTLTAINTEIGSSQFKDKTEIIIAIMREELVRENIDYAPGYNDTIYEKAAARH